MALDAFLASIRRLESGSFEGNYQFIGRAQRGVKPRGAYGILDSNWDNWAERAGLRGADWRDPNAQDRVAAHRAQELIDTYGGYDVAAAAWIGGTESARKIVQRGYDGPESIQSQEIREYVESYKTYEQEVPTFAGKSEPTQAYMKKPAARGQAGWVMPVAGETEFSNGSWMPNSHTHRGRTHAAMDVYAKTGTPIVAPKNGKVLSVKTSKIGGHTARILGDDGIIYYFAHMNEASVVKAGQKVLAGNHIGFVGNSGSAKNTKPHLHFSMKKENGEAINPYTYLTGAADATGVYPSSQAYGSEGGAGAMTASGQMNTMLDQFSNKIAGGKRGPSVMPTEQVGETGEELPSTEDNQ